MTMGDVFVAVCLAMLISGVAIGFYNIGRRAGH